MENKAQTEVDFFIRVRHGLEYAVYVTCILSILGSLLIILTYLFFRGLRTKVRLILLHLSLMDLGIGLSNLIGTAVDFNKYYYKYYNYDNNRYGLTEFLHPNITIQTLCKTQAFFAMYCTYGSVFWTSCLALYLYFAVVHHSAKIDKIFFWFSSIFCYSMPLILSLWLILTDRLGPTPYGSGGWCSIVNVHPLNDQKDYFLVSFGYDMWIYLTFILVSVLYFGTRAQVSIQYQRSKDYVDANTFWAVVHRIDYKFLLIPLSFIFLRIWSCIIAILSVYSDGLRDMMKNDQNNNYGRYFIAPMYFLSAIGDSGQGAINGIIFVLFTKKVRDKLLMPCARRKVLPHDETDRLLNAKKVPNRNDYYSSNTPSPPSSPVSLEH